MAYWVWREDMGDWVGPVDPAEVAAMGGAWTPYSPHNPSQQVTSATKPDFSPESPFRGPAPGGASSWKQWMNPTSASAGAGGSFIEPPNPEVNAALQPYNLGPETSSTAFVGPVMRPFTTEVSAMANDPTKQFNLDQQDPGTQWQRYLANLTSQNNLGGGVRDLLDKRGGMLSNLAQLYGYGPSSGVGGQGNDMSSFYGQYAAQNPSWGDTRGKLNSLRQNMGEQQAWNNRSEAQIAADTKNNITPRLSENDQFTAAYYGDPTANEDTGATTGGGRQLAALLASLYSQLPPWMRGSVGQYVGQQHQDWQSRNPGSTAFLDYMQNSGLF